jgi:hypothetical protein
VSLTEHNAAVLFLFFLVFLKRLRALECCSLSDSVCSLVVVAAPPLGYMSFNAHASFFDFSGAGAAPKWVLGADAVVLPLSTALAVWKSPERMPMSLLNRAAELWASV